MTDTEKKQPKPGRYIVLVALGQSNPTAYRIAWKCDSLDEAEQYVKDSDAGEYVICRRSRHVEKKVETVEVPKIRDMW